MSVRFIRVHGHVVPIKSDNMGKESERYGKKAGKFLGKVGPLKTKAKQFHALAAQQISSPNPAMKSVAAATSKKALHYEKRSAQASALGNKLGNISEGLKGRTKFASARKITPFSGVVLPSTFKRQIISSKVAAKSTIKYAKLLSKARPLAVPALIGTTAGLAYTSFKNKSFKSPGESNAHAVGQIAKGITAGIGVAAISFTASHLATGGKIKFRFGR